MVSPFKTENTFEDVFTLTDGTEAIAEYMPTRRVSLKAVNGGNYYSASLSFENGYQFVAVLPHHGITVNELLENPELVNEAVLFSNKDRLIDVDINWRVPKFDFKSKQDLISLTKTIGLHSLFTRAELDNLYSNNPEETHTVASIIQQSLFNIDEQGAEAKAVTVITESTTEIEKEPPPPPEEIDMFLDRPFIFAIVTDNGLLLFTGVVNNPTFETETNTD